MQSPHDQLFHYTFGQPENAADLLRGTLPAAIGTAIDWQTLVRCDTKLSDAESEGLYADVLFTVQTQGRTAYVFLLLEHKSEEHPETAYQLLRYVVRIWDRHRSEQPGAGLLPAAADAQEAFLKLVEYIATITDLHRDRVRCSLPRSMPMQNRPT